jgi:hypothetical protein
VAVRNLRRDRIGRAVVVVDVVVAAAGDSRSRRLVGAVDSCSWQLLVASDSQSIGPAFVIVGSLWREG